MGQVYGMEELTLSSIAEMDGGRIGEAMRQALKRIAQDMDDRPGDNRPRKIQLEIAAEPTVGEDGMIDGAKLQMQVKETLPTRKTKVYDMGVRKGGMLVFQPLALDNHMQDPLPFHDDDGE